MCLCVYVCAYAWGVVRMNKQRIRHDYVEHALGGLSAQEPPAKLCLRICYSELSAAPIISITQAYFSLPIKANSDQVFSLGEKNNLFQKKTLSPLFYLTTYLIPPYWLKMSQIIIICSGSESLSFHSVQCERMDFTYYILRSLQDVKRARGG